MCAQYYEGQFRAEVDEVPVCSKSGHGLIWS